MTDQQTSDATAQKLPLTVDPEPSTSGRVPLLPSALVFLRAVSSDHFCPRCTPMTVVDLTSQKVRADSLITNTRKTRAATKDRAALRPEPGQARGSSKHANLQLQLSFQHFHSVLFSMVPYWNKTSILPVLSLEMSPGNERHKSHTCLAPMCSLCQISLNFLQHGKKWQACWHFLAWELLLVSHPYPFLMSSQPWCSVISPSGPSDAIYR